MMTHTQIGKFAVALLLAAMMTMTFSSCATTPENVEDICAIFKEKGRWYKDARKSEERWGTPVHVQLAIIHQESTFDFNGKLKQSARRVEHRAKEWGAQLQRCEDDLDDGWWIFGEVRPSAGSGPWA